MGFFKDLKEDLSMAVSEFAGEENAKASKENDIFAAAEESMGIDYDGSVDEPVIEEALSSFLDQVAANAEEAEYKYDEVPERKGMPSTEELNFAAKAAMAKAANNTYEDKAPSYEESPVYETTSYDEPAVSYSEPEPVYSAPSYSYEQPSTVVYSEMTESQPTDELAVITANMTIKGDMTSTGSLDVMGTVTGDVKIMGELNITGTINGSCEASNIIATNCNVNGNLVSTGAIKIGSKAVIKGNVYATSAVISGAIKGDIDVHGPVILDSTAIVMGNIKSKAVQINNGAAIEGMCSQCYADVSPSAFFRD